ncbi:MAG: hypothetical protein RLZZ584_1187 [Pseudomonadota bacterium]|jgi:drug/metabolite transporter (DMT)-like permease
MVAAVAHLPPDTQPDRCTLCPWQVDSSRDEVTGLGRTPGSLYDAVTQLRKVLGTGHIATVPRKGYRLATPVTRPDDDSAAPRRAATPSATRPAGPSATPSATPPATSAATPAPDTVPPRLGTRSVAVLPFVMRGLPETVSFLSESLAGALISDLSRQPGLVVVTLGTMLTYGQRHPPPQQLAGEPGVRYVVDSRRGTQTLADEPRDEQLARALTEAERAVAIDPRDPDAHYVLSLAVRQFRGQRQRADEALRHCLRLSSSYAPAYGLLAQSQERQGRHDEARAHCDQAFELSPLEPLRVIWHFVRAEAALATVGSATFFYLMVWKIASTYAAVLIPSGQASVLGFTMPLWSALISWAVLRERLSARMLLGLLGLLGLLAGLGWAIGSLVLKRGQVAVHALVLTGWQLLITALPTTLGALWLDHHQWFMPSWQAVVVVAHIALVPMSIGKVAWLSIVRLLPVNVAGLSSLMVPMVAMVSGALVHGEPLGLTQWAAIGCSACSLWLVLRAPAPRDT